MADELDRAHLPETMWAHHLSAAEVAGYLDLVVDAVSRRRIEAHLVTCDSCLDEVLAILGLLRQNPDW
jgi:hypothetical protein